MQTKGVVKAITEKAWNGDDGDVTLYSILLENSRDYYRTGQTKPPVRKGDYIEFEFEMKGRNAIVNVNSITKLEAQAAQAAPQVQAEQKSWGGGGGYKAKAAEKDTYWKDKADSDAERIKYDREVVGPRINYAASQRDAIQLIGLALQHDALAFGNAAKGAKLGIILGFVDEVTKRFVAQRNGEEVPTAAPVKKVAKAEPDYNDDLPEEE